MPEIDAGRMKSRWIRAESLQLIESRFEFTVTTHHTALERIDRPPSSLAGSDFFISSLFSRPKLDFLVGGNETRRNGNARGTDEKKKDGPNFETSSTSVAYFFHSCHQKRGQ